MVIGEEDEEAASSLWLDHLAPRRPWSSADYFNDYFRKIGSTANECEGARIRKWGQGANFDKNQSLPYSCGMPRSLRIEFPGAYWHVMAKLVARKLGLAVGASGSAALVKLEVDLRADFLNDFLKANLRHDVPLKDATALIFRISTPVHG